MSIFRVFHVRYAPKIAQQNSLNVVTLFLSPQLTCTISMPNTPKTGNSYLVTCHTMKNPKNRGLRFDTYPAVISDVFSKMWGLSPTTRSHIFWICYVCISVRPQFRYSPMQTECHFLEQLSAPIIPKYFMMWRHVALTQGHCMHNDCKSDMLKKQESRSRNGHMHLASALTDKILYLNARCTSSHPSHPHAPPAVPPHLRLTCCKTGSF